MPQSIAITPIKHQAIIRKERHPQRLVSCVKGKQWLQRLLQPLQARLPRPGACPEKAQMMLASFHYAASLKTAHTSNSETSHPQGSARSGLYNELCEALGKDCAARMCALFGGRWVYLSNVETNRIARQLGGEVAQKMVNTYGRGYMYIPMAGLRGHRKVPDLLIVKALCAGGAPTKSSNNWGSAAIESRPYADATTYTESPAIPGSAAIKVWRYQ